jgi:hypothetical protein
MCLPKQDISSFESGREGTYLVRIGSIRACDNIQSREEEMALLERSGTAQNLIGEVEHGTALCNCLPAGLAAG